MSDLPTSDFPQDMDPAVQSGLRELMQGDYPLLIDTFMDDAQKRLAALAEALEQQHWEAFRQSAHSFKGSCGNMGAQALQQACERAEQAALHGDSAAAAQCCRELRQLFQRVQKHLQP